MESPKTIRWGVLFKIVGLVILFSAGFGVGTLFWDNQALIESKMINLEAKRTAEKALIACKARMGGTDI